MIFQRTMLLVNLLKGKAGLIGLEVYESCPAGQGRGCNLSSRIIHRIHPQKETRKWSPPPLAWLIMMIHRRAVLQVVNRLRKTVGMLQLALNVTAYQEGDLIHTALVPLL